MLWISSLLGWF